ncbi:MAG: S8 family serine peptidase [FCB group bacterium]|nr:S8 family serine peptidase [FCB group bacterium]
MKPYHVFISAVLLNITVFARDYYPNRVLVQLQKDVSRQEFATVVDNKQYEIENVLVRRLGIVSIRLKGSRISAANAVNELRRNPWVKYAQLDHQLSLRQAFPNDPQFENQWNLHNIGQTDGVPDADIDAPEAWEITTGGVTPLGDTIVVAVVDEGCLITHPDLKPNLWRNRGEIPGNGIDDDQNGYDDDVNGWNAYDSSGNIPSSGHGTHVSGIVGARGNNDSLVAGVNWKVKIMPVVAGNYTLTSVVMKAYGYILDQRLLYNSTNGAKGAFVVAVNSSFGIDSADCSSNDYPLWNVMYRAMGEAGILSVAATMNTGADVDVTGDVPTGCDSDYLVTVTNTTKNDIKHSGAAYGALSIDLGAPGTGILSTYPGVVGTSKLSGTSFAAPHVAGAIGYLYAAMNTKFAAYCKKYPAEGALAVKQVIIRGVDSLATLQGVTVSGGRLNLFKSGLLALDQIAPDSLDPQPISNLRADTSRFYQIKLSWDDPVALVGGDAIPDFVIDIFRNNDSLTTVGAGVREFVDEHLSARTIYTYTCVTRLVSNDSTGVPVSLTTQVPGGWCIPGDVTRDGLVDTNDINEMVRFVMDYEVTGAFDTCAADVDNDSTVSVLDVLLTTDIILDQP